MKDKRVLKHILILDLEWIFIIFKSILTKTFRNRTRKCYDVCGKEEIGVQLCAKPSVHG